MNESAVEVFSNQPTARTVPPLIDVFETKAGGKLYRHVHYNFHAGQSRAFRSKKRIVLVLAAWRSGKSEIGPPWLYERIRRCGPGNYLVAAPDFTILDKAAKEKIERLFSRIHRLGKMYSNPLEYRLSPAGEQHFWPGRVCEVPTRIIFGHADAPDSLAAMQVKAAWLDEAGQHRFKLGSWEEIQARLSIDKGDCLITTRPYSMGGWLKNQVYDPWKAERDANRDHPFIDVVNFAYKMNPAHDPEYDERARREMPGWKYRMLFKGLFERPAGMIYDNFAPHHIAPPFSPPEKWERFVGMDFGGINTAAIFFAREPYGPYWAYREYWPQVGRTAKQHALALLEGEPRTPTVCGGSKSEGQWRSEFAAAGIPIHEPPVSNVEVGINRLYKMFANNEIKICSNLEHTLDQLQSYSREVDENGEPTDEIEDPHSAHLCDSARYFAAFANAGGLEFKAYLS